MCQAYDNDVDDDDVHQNDNDNDNDDDDGIDDEVNGFHPYESWALTHYNRVL